MASRTSTFGLTLCALALLVACNPAPTSKPQPPRTPSSSAAAIDVRAAVGSGTTLDFGSPDAPLTLLIFTNHSCAYCREFWQLQVPQLNREFIATKKVLLRVAILPIQKYPESVPETKALFCAGKQGKGGELHGALFTLLNHTDASVLLAAKAANLDADAFSSCLTSSGAIAYAEQQKTLAENLGVTLVPTFFLNDERQVGLPKEADLRGWIESNLR